ncbi:MAG: CehA/McbA family metallohydrolase [Solirubrobacterales bacterium]
MLTIFRKSLLVLTILAAALIAPATASATDCGIPGSADGSFTNTALEVQGDIAASRAGGYLQIPFDVPTGTTAIRVRYSYDQPGGGCGGSPNTLDMGVYDPRESGETVFGADDSRGWSGSAVKDLAIAQNGFSPESVYNASNSARKAYVHGYTTRAYQPGSVTPGTWAVELGIAYIDPSDTDGIHYHVRVETSTSTDWSNSPYTPSGYSTAPASTAAGWYAGDLHVHGEQEPGNAPVTQTLNRAFDAPPGGSGLDFVTLVDHNNQVQHDNLATYQAAHPGKLVIPGTEMTTYQGHFNNQGKAPFVDFRTGAVLQPTGSPPYSTLTDGDLGQVRGSVPPSQIFGEIQSNGNWTQINHPSIFKTAPSVCRGCAWSYSDADTDFSRVDAIEVQTGPAGIPYSAPSSPNPFTPDAIAYYEHALDSGAHIAAVGSSDDHQGGGATGPTDSPVGSATTMVYAKELSEQAITDAIKGDHTYVKMFGNDGPVISLEADVPGEPTAMIGDSVTGPSVKLTATVSGASASGRIGSWSLLLLRDGQAVQTWPFSGDGTSQTFEVSDGGRYSLEVLRNNADLNYIENYSSPVWFTPGAPSFKLGKSKANKKKGTGKLSVTVGNPGKITLSGKSLAKSSKTASGAGTYKLNLKPKGKLKKTLKKKGKAKVKVTVGFTPDGGEQTTLTKKVKLLRK